MRKLITSVLIIAGIFALLSFSVPAYVVQGTETSNTIEDFDFEDYLAIINSIAQTEEYPHFLAKNAQRYDEYKENNPDMPYDIVFAHVNVDIDKEPYADIQPVLDPDKITVLVNKNFVLPSDWEPDDFVELAGGHLMREEAAEHFLLMREAMREEGLNLNIIITYRTYASQRNHFNNAVSRVGLASAEAGFARPGHSEHQTGLAIDVLHKAHDGGLMMNMGFEDSKQFHWLVENAHEFGFILRFPEGYRNLSGFIFEPWHWRYVGIPIAMAMYNEEIPFYEEFYGRYLVQGVLDKVNQYILEQQYIAESEAAAAEAAAEAAIQEAIAAEIAEAEARAAEAAEAAKAAEAEEAAKAAKDALAAEIAEAEIKKNTMPSGSRHFLEGISIVVISAAIIVWHLILKKKRV